MADPHNPTGNLGSGRCSTRTRECACGRRITVGGPFTQHARACGPAQEAEVDRETRRLLRQWDVG